MAFKDSGFQVNQTFGHIMLLLLAAEEQNGLPGHCFMSLPVLFS